jgi:transposase
MGPVSGIVQVLRSGCPWRHAPREYGPPKTLYNRYVRWAIKGVWPRIFETLATAGGPPAEVLLDATYAKAHRSAAGGGEGGSARKPSGGRVVAGPPRSTPRQTKAASRSHSSSPAGTRPTSAAARR